MICLLLSLAAEVHHSLLMTSSHPAGPTTFSALFSFCEDRGIFELPTAESVDALAGRKSPLATENLLEVIDGLRRPPPF